MKKKGELKGDLPHLLDIAVTRAATPERQAQAWAYLCPASPQALEDVLAEAGILFAEGRLFVNEGMDPKDDPEVVEENKEIAASMEDEAHDFDAEQDEWGRSLE